MNKILIINGANLNLLGTREPNIYGKITLQEIEKACINNAKNYNYEIVFFQSNIEGEIINKIQECSSNGVNKLIINAGAFSHTSVAIMDCILATKIKAIEVHISNIYSRESFRHNSYISKSAIGVICGLGINGYLYAIDYLCKN